MRAGKKISLSKVKVCGKIKRKITPISAPIEGVLLAGIYKNCCINLQMDNGFLISSPVKKVDGELIHTRNSIYLIKVEKVNRSRVKFPHLLLNNV